MKEYETTGVIHQTAHRNNARSIPIIDMTANAFAVMFRRRLTQI